MLGLDSIFGVRSSSVLRIAALGLSSLLALAGCQQRAADFCCQDQAVCEAAGAPGPVACEQGKVCDLANNRCVTAQCTGDQDCTDPATPACSHGLCVACDDQHACPSSAPVCSAVNACEACVDDGSCSSFATAPHCGPGGACVACRPSSASDCTMVTAPICDSTSDTCRACKQGECGSGVCDTSSGECIDSSKVVYVNQATGSGSSCTQAQPCKRISDGVTAVTAGRSYILVAAGSYSETVTIDGKTLTLLGAGADLQPGGLGQAGIVVLNSSTAVLEGLHVHDAGGGANGDGVRCAVTSTGTPSVTVREMTINGCSGQGVDAASCTVAIDRSTLSGNTGGGVSISGGSATLTNNMIDLNGGLTSTIGNVKLDSLTALSFDFNTVADGAVSTGFAAGVQCTAATPLTLSDSIVFGSAATQVNVTNCSFAYSLSNQSLPGSNNLTTTDPKFVNPSQSDYHIQTNSPAVAAANPAATVAVDIDGDARPLPAGTRRDVGADEVQQ